MGRVLGLSLLLPSVALAGPTTGASGASQRQEGGALGEALKAFNNFDDDGAEKLLRHLLKERPTAHQSALAHLYLGLIALNRSNAEVVWREFEAAIETDPLVELPRSASPKARLFFNQAAERVAKKAGATPLRVQVMAEQPPPPPPSVPSRAPTFVVGGVALAAIGGGIVTGLLAQGALNNANAPGPVNTKLSDQSKAGSLGLVADICFGAGAALGITSVILFFTSMPPSDSGAEPPKVSLSASPLPQGGLVQVGGAF